MEEQTNVYIPQKKGSHIRAWNSVSGAMSRIPEVNSHVSAICGDIANGSLLKLDLDIRGTAPKIYNNGDITSMFIGLMKWRLCTGYIFVQKSDRGTRILIYLHDKVMHHGGGFGTTPAFVTPESCLDDMKAATQKFKCELYYHGFPKLDDNYPNDWFHL